MIYIGITWGTRERGRFLSVTIDSQNQKFQGQYWECAFLKSQIILSHTKA